MTLAPERIAAIDAAVLALHDAMRSGPGPDGTLAVPIDIDAAARLCGLRIVTLPEGVTGSAVRNVAGTAVSGMLDFASGRVYVDGREVPTRQRFTIAHEIAHEVLGHEQQLGPGPHVVWQHPRTQASERDIDVTEGEWAPGEQSVDRELVEREADYFAGRLLVPPFELARVVEELGCASVPLLAWRFAVSALAMQVHIRPYLPPFVDQ